MDTQLEGNACCCLLAAYLMCVFLPPEKGFPDFGAGRGLLVLPLQPGSLPGGEGAAR